MSNRTHDFIFLQAGHVRVEYVFSLVARGYIHWQLANVVAHKWIRLPLNEPIQALGIALNSRQHMERGVTTSVLRVDIHAQVDNAVNQLIVSAELQQVVKQCFGLALLRLRQ